ncbi:MAG: sulfate reduction electron transfer complex DsrMKJOP subunit DsrM [Gemmatimonadota bacterium]|jgi:nitrate reductase gamma subunit
MKVLVPLAVVAGLILAALLGATSSPWVFGVGIPYLAISVFVIGMIARVLAWAQVPVPFRIPTTAGQQKSLPWIPRNRLDNPHSTLGVVGRMALEVLFFRSLLRNTRTQMSNGRLVYGTSLTLWGAALAMHWSMLIILVRHLRLFTQPVPAFVTFVQNVDGFLQVGLPVFYVTTVLFLLGLAYLLYRRLANPLIRYISLASDYFPLFLLLGIGITGFWMRHLSRTDVRGIKELALGLAHFTPVVPDGISALFFAHLFLVSVLLMYFPFSKLVHAGGVFLSPTRNLANTNRAIRHINPWDYPVHVHTYEEYEDELREKMIAAGIPVEKEE